MVLRIFIFDFDWFFSDFDLDGIVHPSIFWGAYTGLILKIAVFDFKASRRATHLFFEALIQV